MVCELLLHGQLQKTSNVEPYMFLSTVLFHNENTLWIGLGPTD